jgi:hypothetical protein
MQRVNEFDLYTLASQIHPLILSTGTKKFKEIWIQWWHARTALINFRSQRPISVCLPATHRLTDAIDVVVPREVEAAIEKAQSEDQEVPSYQVHEVGEAAREFETVMSAEIQTMDTYFVSQKGPYRTPDLIERAEIIFPESIREYLSDKTKKDIREAGRCLALDIPTGAGFHILRALESTMADYYQEVIGKPIPTRMRNWGIYIQKLRKSDEADIKVLDFLDHIRENYRNPIQHPEIFLSMDEVEILLGVATSSIRQMVLAIQNLREHLPLPAQDIGEMLIPELPPADALG